MLTNKFKDCYFTYQNDTLSIGNVCIEREIAFENNYPVTRHIKNIRSGYTWSNDAGKDMASFNLQGLDFGKCSVDFYTTISDNQGLSEKFLLVSVVFEGEKIVVRWEFEIFPELPFITTKLYIKGKTGIENIDNSGGLVFQQATGIEILDRAVDVQSEKVTLPEQDVVDAFGIYNKHLKLETIRLYDVTDYRDTLVEKTEELAYLSQRQFAGGNIFLLNSYLENEGLMVIKEGLTAQNSLNRNQDELLLKPSAYIQLTGTGVDYKNLLSEEFIPCYGSTIGVCSIGQLKSLYKKYYNQVYKGDLSNSLFIMSNTWGDRNQDKAICEEFILKEIEAGAKLGVDIIQVDDGWQKGITSNSALAKGGVWEGYYSFDPDFWEVNIKKFPKGLEPVIKSAQENNIKLGLWFSPDSSNDFINWEKDAQILLNLYRKYDVRYFKFDGVKIRNKICEVNMIKLMKKVSEESDRKVSLNLDITAERRFGYFYEKQFGTLFVENRYTDWGNYYPHTTLKNLWQLSEILPARKFQFEMLNIQRNKQKYENDLLAPSNYTIDYVFAITMFSNPLIWMEMSHLQSEDQEVLMKVISVYKKERAKIFNSEVFPLGSLPDGISFTGFQAKCNENEGYLLLFREFTQSEDYIYKINSLEDKKIKIEYLYVNGDTNDFYISENVSVKNDLKVKFAKPRTFAFIKYSLCV